MAVQGELHKLEQGTLLYKGFKSKVIDPLTASSSFSNYLDSGNKFKWFTTSNKVADIYTRGTGCVWIYQLQKPTYVLRLNKPSAQPAPPAPPAQPAPIIEGSMQILHEVIMKNGADFYMKNVSNPNPTKRPLNELLGNYGKLPHCNVYDALQTPFGLVSTKEQSDVTGVGQPKDTLFVQDIGKYNAGRLMFQRYSFHHLDKYLVKFMYDYRREIFGKCVQATTEVSLDGINGYIAENWNTKWYGGEFHEELCLFETEYTNVQNDKSPIIFIGRYEIVNDAPIFLGPNNEKINGFNLQTLRQFSLGGKSGGAKKKSGGGTECTPCSPTSRVWGEKSTSTQDSEQPQLPTKCETNENIQNKLKELQINNEALTQDKELDSNVAATFPFTSNAVSQSGQQGSDNSNGGSPIGGKKMKTKKTKKKTTV